MPILQRQSSSNLSNFAKTTNAMNLIQRNNKLKRLLILFIIYLFILVATAVIFKRIATQDNTFSKHTFIISFTIILTFFFVFLYTLGYGNIGSFTFNRQFVVNSFIGVMMLIFVFFLYTYLNKTTTLLVYYIICLLIFFIVIVGLTILFNVFHNNLIRGNHPPALKFIIELIFFIPCLFNDFVKYILEQFKITPKITYVLLFIEFILILLYMYLPKYMNKLTMKNGIVLHKKPYYINNGKPLVIASMKDLGIKDDDLLSINKENLFYKNYGFSMWININPQNTSSKNETTLFCYGFDCMKDTKSVKPCITYTYNDDLKKDVYKIYYTKNNMHFEIQLPNQRWNHFFFNYKGNQLDLFINGNLVRSVTLDPLPTYTPEDQVVIGNDKMTGLNGAICDVVYYKTNLSSTKIASIYNKGNSFIQFI